MDAARKSMSPEQAPVALIVLTAIVYVAGFSMVIAWFALVVLGQPAPSSSGPPSGSSTCHVCGVVEGVAEFERSSFQLNGEQNEGIVVLLAQLGGLKSMPIDGHVYETAVLHDDGSVRVVRDTSVPQWKRGDRVRVVRGRVEPISAEVAAR